MSGAAKLTQAEKGRAFRALHEREGAFIIPNPWDAGSARLLAHLGFEALATTSMGYAFSIGKLDTTLSRDEALANAQDKGREAAGAVRDVSDNFVEAIDESLAKRPYTTLAIVAAIGFVFGATWRR